MAAASTSNQDHSPDKPEEDDEETIFGELTTKEISRMVITGLGSNQGGPLFNLGGVDRFIKMTRFFERKVAAKSQHVDDEEFIRHYGISSATIGDRVKNFGSGDLRIRENPRFTQSLQSRHINRISDMSFMDDPYDTRRHNDDDDENDYFFSGRGVRFTDQIQNGTLFEVIRDGERVNVYGSQLVFGDVLVLEANTSKNVPLEEFLKQITAEKEQKKQESKNNKNDDDDDNNQDENKTNPANRHEPFAEKDPKEEARRWKQRSRLARAHQTKIPADCVVLEGSVDQDAVDLTGENMIWECTRRRNPVLVAGARIIGGKCLALVIAVGQDSNMGIFTSTFLDRQENGTGLKKCRGRTCCCC